MSASKWVRFSKDYTVKDHARTTYREGQVVELPEASAFHFVTRGAADECEPPPPPPVVPPAGGKKADAKAEKPADEKGDDKK